MQEGSNYVHNSRQITTGVVLVSGQGSSARGAVPVLVGVYQARVVVQARYRESLSR